MKKLLSIAIMISTLVCSLFIPTRAFEINNSSLTASSFVSNMKAGWNLGNSLDAYFGDPTGDGNLSQETVWGNPQIVKQHIDYIKSLGFDVIRLPVTWHTHIYRDENGTIHIHKDWLDRVKTVVDYCIADGIFVILNTHHDDNIIHAGVTDSSFNAVKADAAAIWTDISNYFSAYDNHLIFESYNEVDNFERSWSFGSKAATQLNELNQLFVDIVRNSGANNAGRILMVPTLLDKPQSNFQKAFKLPKDTVSDKIIVTVHDYSQQFDQTLDSSFASLEKFSKFIGAPIIIGEWGTTDGYVPSSYRKIHASNFIARAKNHGIKCIYWDNGYDFAIINRYNYSANMDMISAIMNPTPYESDNVTTLSKWNDFLYMTFDTTTGELMEDRHWGTLVVNKDGNGYCVIPSGKTMLTVSLFATDSMAEQRIHCLYFFDINNNLIATDGDFLGYNEKSIEIPAGSSYVRIGINNPYSKTSASEYKKAMKSGNFVFMINFY